jgi:hypothetical protein
MSRISDVEAHLLGLVAAAGIRTEFGPQDHHELEPGGLPVAYSIGFAKEGAENDDGTEAVTYSGAIVFVFETSIEGARAAAEALDAAIVADRTLGGLVERAFVASIDSYTEAAGEQRQRFVAAATIASADDPVSSSPTLIRWSVTAALLLKTTGVQSWAATIDAALAAELSGVRLASDLTDPPTEPVPEGELRYALELAAAPVIHGSNIVASSVACELRVYRRLAAIEAERDYTMGPMLAQMLAVAARDFWLAGLTDAEIDGDGPEVGDVERLTS